MGSKNDDVNFCDFLRRTTNFIHGLSSHYAISVAVAKSQKKATTLAAGSQISSTVLMGVVYKPAAGELYFADNRFDGGWKIMTPAAWCACPENFTTGLGSAGVSNCGPSSSSAHSADGHHQQQVSLPTSVSKQLTALGFDGEKRAGKFLLSSFIAYEASCKFKVYFYWRCFNCNR
jgi:hypothetical protein